MLRRLGADEEDLLVVQGNLAGTYRSLGRHEEALRLRREVYSGHLKLHGEEHPETLREAYNYASLLGQLKRFEEAKTLSSKTLPVTRRVFGDNNDLTLRMKKIHALALFGHPAATLDDLREAVSMLDETGRTARHVLGEAHPTLLGIEVIRRAAQRALSARTRGEGYEVRVHPSLGACPQNPN